VKRRKTGGPGSRGGKGSRARKAAASRAAAEAQGHDLDEVRSTASLSGGDASCGTVLTLLAGTPLLLVCSVISRYTLTPLHLYAHPSL